MSDQTEAKPVSVRATFKRGFEVSPEMRKGLVVTLLLAGVAAAGQAAVPFLTQRITDLGLLAPGGVDTSVVVKYAIVGVIVSGPVDGRRVARAGADGRGRRGGPRDPPHRRV